MPESASKAASCPSYDPCAGTNAETIKPTLTYLKQRGILPILNYAAEADVQQDNEDQNDSSSGPGAEKDLEAQARIFMRSIDDCDNATPSRGFVGIKVSLFDGKPHPGGQETYLNRA